MSPVELVYEYKGKKDYDDVGDKAHDRYRIYFGERDHGREM